jgi:peroxiredoxin
MFLKVFAFVSLISIPFFVAGKTGKFQVKGKITITKEDKDWVPIVYLLRMANMDQFFGGSIQTVVDSSKIKPDGTFSFSNPDAVADNSFYRLNVIKKEYEGNGGGIYMVGTNEGFAFLLLNKTSDIEFKTRIGKFDHELQPIKMDRANYLIRNLYDLRRKENEVIDSVINIRQTLEAKGKQYEDSVKQLNQALYQFALSGFSRMKNFADTVSDPYVSLLSTAFFETEDTSFLKNLLARYNKEIPNSIYTRQFEARIKGLAFELKTGSPAPEIQMKDMNGKTISLSELRGKFVLIDFWASWCHPCRKENLETLKPAFEKFKGRGFTILSISQDIKKENWLKAIKSDDIDKWPQVSDLKGSNSETSDEYRVSGLPTNFLVNRDGIIVARNLRGLELEKVLSEMLKD